VAPAPARVDAIGMMTPISHRDSLESSAVMTFIIEMDSTR
jgi:hypothetical protein